MTHATYDSYKESGVPWLGKVPAGWEVRKFANFYSARMGQTILGKDVEESGKIPVLSATEKESIFGYIEKADVVLQPNDLVIPARGNSIGHVKLVKFPCTSTQTTILCRQIQSMNPAFVQYYLLGLRKVLFYFDRTAIPQITVDQVKTNPLLVPPLTEQKAIAEFLDNKTAQIDALITKKKNLLKLLAEQRTALITNTVTRGLDDSAPMKESGITWLGKVPNHWEVKRLRFLLSEPLKYGANESAEFEDRTNPRYIRITDVNEDGSLREETFKSLPEEVAAPYILDDGDILLARSGSIGLSFIYRKSWGRAAYAGYLIRARLHKSNDTQFIYRYLNSKTFWDWLNSVFIQSTIKNVNAEKYGNLPVPIPPLAEQKAIADFLDCKTAEIDATKDRIKTAIDTLMEYRTALITNAVTGKIDVRHTAK